MMQEWKGVCLYYQHISISYSKI